MNAGLSSTSSGSLLGRLRTRTADLHRRIEAVVPLLREDLDRARYRDHLARLLGYIAPLEARLHAFRPALLAAGVDVTARQKAMLLEADLAALGVDAPALAALPRCGALPALPSLDHAWGAVYVLEGSTLGGLVVKRTLGPKLGLSVDRGLRFLSGYGEQTASSFRAFADGLQRHERARCDPEAVIRGARDTFETMTEWLCDG